MKGQKPCEPVLRMRAIQGMALPGFLKQHQRLLGLAIPRGDEVVSRFKGLLSEIAESLATAEQTLKDRRAHREGCANPRARALKVETGDALVGIGFSYQGLLRLTPGANAIPSEGFRQGLAMRSAFLGDPVGSAAKWVVGKPGQELDALVVVAADTKAIVDEAAEKLIEKFRAVGCDIPYDQNGDVRADAPGHEHFGFDDGVSQPGIRGLASDAPDDYITQRCIDSSDTPEHWLFGRPGQNLVWPGEFILGYAASSPDPLLPGPVARATPGWTRDGSFLVFRRLAQNVGLFWSTMKQLSEELAKKPGFQGQPGSHGITDVELASRLVGRWPSGAPVNRVPGADLKALGEDKNANNHFRFDSDTKPVPVPGYTDPYPMATADPAGTTCPWAAHIRKVHPRDSATDMGGRDSAYTRRILRVGIPFGEPAEDPYATTGADAQKERGLLFLCVQASIENQFEFLTARWMNDAVRPKMPGGMISLWGRIRPLMPTGCADACCSARSLRRRRSPQTSNGSSRREADTFLFRRYPQCGRFSPISES